MHFEPKQHQQLALDFLRSHKCAGLFLDMGLGKTVTTLTYVKELLDDFAVCKVLVIAPKRVAEETWSTEVGKWDHLSGVRVSKVLGSQTARIKALSEEADIYVINRENVVWLVELLGKRWPFDMVVIDELSSFKSSNSKRWRALKRVIKLSPRVIGLTGTPAPNGYIDLWPQVYLLDGGERLGKTLGEFRSRYFSPGAHKGHIVFEWRLKPGAKSRIDRELSTLCVSMQKDDWITLPPLISNTIHVDLEPSSRRVYDTMKNDLVLPMLEGKLSSIKDFDEVIIGGTAAAVANKLLQLANGFVYKEDGSSVVFGNEKLKALGNIVEESQGEPLLVFYSFREDRDRILKEFPFAEEIGAGSTDRWNRGEVRMLLCHPASAGHGLNLQNGGHICVWYGLPWSLELYEQASARLYRMGQEHPVIMHHIVTRDTLDVNVMAALQDKGSTQKGLLDALKGYLTNE